MLGHAGRAVTHGWNMPDAEDNTWTAQLHGPQADVKALGLGWSSPQRDWLRRRIPAG